MKYILIILIVANGNLTSTKVEYETLLECEKGRDTFVKEYKASKDKHIRNQAIDLQCIKK